MGNDPLAPPDLPPARFVELADRGPLAVRHLPAPPGAPTLMLLHGWTATGDLNWFRCFDRLAEHYGVVSFDHRGHGAGLRSRRTFRLEDCADDAIAIADAIGLRSVIPVGYSMGGTVAQLMWRRAPERVPGLVLCATAPHFVERRDERLSFLGITGLAALARVTPSYARDWLTDQLYLQRKSAQWEPWAIQQAASHDWRMILEAGRAIGGFSARGWIGGVDVPTSIVTTMNDRVIPLRRQVELFERIPGAEAFRVHADHDAVVADHERFVPTLLRATRSVVDRIERSRPAGHAAADGRDRVHRITPGRTTPPRPPLADWPR